MLGILAQAQEANPITFILFPVLMLAVFYFLLIRPQSQRRKMQMQMQSAIEVGDEIVTTAGIYGTITDIDDDFGILTLEVAPGTQIRLARAAVATRLMDEEEIDEEDEVGNA
ncbi:MAG: preprotein translocase subunit YajC [Actinomycetota bacterium]